MELNLIEYGEEVRINLAYVHRSPKNPLFESKIKRGYHGRFGNKFQIPDYTHKALQLEKSAGGWNDSRWAKPLPHPQHKEVTSKAPAELFGKGGKKVPHAVSSKWDDHFLDSRRGRFTIKKDYKTKEFALLDYSGGETGVEVGRYETLEAAKISADNMLTKSGAGELAPYTPPKDVPIDEPDPKGVTAAGLLIREPDGRIWIREPANHFAGYTNSVPKGTAEEGESLQQTAHREAYEETGLKAKIVGYLGDFQGDAMSMTRMYIADRTGGEPTTNDETWAVKLVTPDEAHTLLDRERDVEILSTYSPSPDEKWLIKAYGGNEDRVATELLSNSIYRVLGVDVPKAGIIMQDGRVALTYPAKKGKIKNITKPSKDFGKGFMADVLVANRDVAGLMGNPKFDNVLWDDKGHAIRIDQGGTLTYRGMGGTKDFTHTPSEVWSMFESYGQAYGTMDVTPLQKREQATEIYRTLTPQRIDDLVDQAPYHDLAMKEHVREVLQSRLRWMGQFGKGMIDEKDDARMPTLEEVLQDSVEKQFTLEDYRYMEDRAWQFYHKPDELYTLAQKVQQSFKFLVAMGVGYSQEVDAEVHDGDPNWKDRVKEHMDSYHVIIAPIKPRDMAEKKANEKYKGDWKKVTDIVRGTISVPHPANIPSAVGAIKRLAEERGWKVSYLNSKLYVDPRRPYADTGPSKNGYRDLTMEIETDEGFQIELSFNWNAMLVADPSDYQKVWEEVAGTPPPQTAEYKKLMVEKKKADDEKWAKQQSKVNIKGSPLWSTSFAPTDAGGTTYVPGQSYQEELDAWARERKAKKKLSVSDEAYQITVKSGGVTISTEGIQPHTGLAYAGFKDTEMIVDAKDFTPKVVADYMVKHADKLPGNYLGLWEDNGKIYLDISTVGDKNAATLQKAMDAHQLAAFDLENFAEVPLGKIDKKGYTPLYEAANHPYLNEGKDPGASPPGATGKPKKV